MQKEETKMKSQTLSMDWLIVLWYIHLHFLGICGIWVMFTDAMWMTVLFGIVVTSIACIGVTVGMHRFYAHQSFATTSPLKIFFILSHTFAGVGSMYNWVVLHRMHHKYFGTNKDPYDFNKGFLYSHYMSNCMKGFLEDTHLVKSIDMRDIELDKFLWIQHKFYWVFFIFVTILLPIYVPVLYWNESTINSFLIMGILRLVIAFNVAALVNSALHVWGLKPEDKYPVDDFSVFWVSRSYWLNYHYVFPRDWKSSEFGKYDTGCGTILIKLWYEFGLIDTLITTSSEQIREILYEIACKKTSTGDAMEKLENLCAREAVQQNLCFKH